MTEEKQVCRWAEETARKICGKIAWVRERNAEKLPYLAVRGSYDDRRREKTGPGNRGPEWWTNGFWAGLLWQMYHETGEACYAETARRTEIWLDECFQEYYGLHHDVGFMWLPSAVADYRLTGDKEARRRGMHAASLLAARFNPVGRFLRAWNENEMNNSSGVAIIDCMMNIPLLYWAAKESGDVRFLHIATQHADTVMRHFVRPDGSVEHIVEFDPVTGEKLRTYKGQGYAEGSSWTRGQAWALYGFVLSYLHTGKTEYRDTAKRIAHYFMANIPESGLIPVDFRQPPDPVREDSSAACIAACGLLELARCVPETEQAAYSRAAAGLLKTLAEKRADFSRAGEELIQKCAGAYDCREEEKECSLIYGDYFFTEAVFKLKGGGFLLW